ncbi:MAG: NAD-dependent epimerase/dehydratase family protein [Cyanobacteriota bacterium]|jgi:CDP-paratose 2-epimerase
MRLLITGACGFVGSELCLGLQDHVSDLKVTGLNNLRRHGSWRNHDRRERHAVRVLHGDNHQTVDLEGMEPQA